MSLLSRAMILEALEMLACELESAGSGRREEIVIAGDLPEVPGRREDVWSAIEPFLVPGRELKARYAFEDLWEAVHGS